MPLQFFVSHKNATEYVWTQSGPSCSVYEDVYFITPVTDTWAPHVIFFFLLSLSPSRRGHGHGEQQQQQHVGSPRAAAAPSSPTARTRPPPFLPRPPFYPRSNRSTIRTPRARQSQPPWAACFRARDRLLFAPSLPYISWASAPRAHASTAPPLPEPFPTLQHPFPPAQPPLPSSV